MFVNSTTYNDWIPFYSFFFFWISSLQKTRSLRPDHSLCLHSKTNKHNKASAKKATFSKPRKEREQLLLSLLLVPVPLKVGEFCFIFRGSADQVRFRRYPCQGSIFGWLGEEGGTFLRKRNMRPKEVQEGEQRQTEGAIEWLNLDGNETCSWGYNTISVNYSCKIGMSRGKDEWVRHELSTVLRWGSKRRRLVPFVFLKPKVSCVLFWFELYDFFCTFCVCVSFSLCICLCVCALPPLYLKSDIQLTDCPSSLPFLPNHNLTLPPACLSFFVPCPILLSSPVIMRSKRVQEE